MHTRGTTRVMVASFTRAAATEIAGRNLPIPRSQVGTLHSLAYRAIGRPDVAQDEDHLADWNARHPAFALSAGYRESALDQATFDNRGGTDGDTLLQRMEALRGMQRPRKLWPMQIQAFSQAWEDWKNSEELIDFTDMIELALSSTEAAPGNPIVGFFDEVQDFTPLELELVRHWGSAMERIVLAGDDDQSLYDFKGATPEAFLDPPLGEDHEMVLSQSYRVPRAVHEVAERWIRRLQRRKDKEYLPRDVEGSVREVSYDRNDLGRLSADVREVVESGRTAMVLTTCAYMLDPLKKRLRELGVPFHNPYRRVRGDWNPLNPPRGVSAGERLLAYLVLDERLFGEAARPWTGEDLKRWTGAIKKQGVFVRGAAGRIAGLPDRELSYGEIADLFASEEELERAVEPSLPWFRERLLASSAKTMRYPIAIVERYGVPGLTETPRCVLGTIHSVKGGQCDVVFLCPELSVAGMQAWVRPGSTRDAITRQMYVGMTRAREELVVLQPSVRTTVPVHALMGRARS